MYTRLLGSLLFCCLQSLALFSQATTIQYQENGTNQLLEQNPFSKFVGAWTLQNEEWIQNWGGTTDTLQIPGHHTVTTALNTANTLLSIIDGPPPNGQIFWSYNPVSKVVNHLSSFGEIRAGVGEGSVSKEGNVRLKINFEGEPKNTYRIYNYRWLDPDTYHMKSVQYNSMNEQTGLFYEGTFVRVVPSETKLNKEITDILAVLDDAAIPVSEQLKVYDDEVVHMAPNSEVHVGKEALKRYLELQRTYGSVQMKHEVVEIEEAGDFILMRGQVTGSFFPKDASAAIPFKTKNLFVFGKVVGSLKIKKVIYNATPIPQDP